MTLNKELIEKIKASHKKRTPKERFDLLVRAKILDPKTKNLRKDYFPYTLGLKT